MSKKTLSLFYHYYGLKIVILMFISSILAAFISPNLVIIGFVVIVTTIIVLGWPQYSYRRNQIIESEKDNTD